MYLGIDIGSVSLNLVLLDDGLNVLRERYVRTRGKPLETALAALEDLFADVPASEIEGAAVTGAGAAVLGEIYGLHPVNEVVAQAKATAHLHPEVRTIVEIGGEDSKLILLEEDPKTGRLRIRDFAMNTLCAAGTGSFLDQQASRLGVSIEKEWGEMALRSVHVPRIAGRCSVFAKSDMIHLQQEGTPDYDIVAGLCFAMARNFKAVIGKGKEFRPVIAFQGGVAANAGMVRAFREALEVADGELLIPKHFASMGAIGAVLTARETGRLGRIVTLCLSARRQFVLLGCGKKRERAGSRGTNRPAVRGPQKVIHNRTPSFPQKRAAQEPARAGHAAGRRPGPASTRQTGPPSGPEPPPPAWPPPPRRSAQADPACAQGRSQPGGGEAGRRRPPGRPGPIRSGRPRNRPQSPRPGTPGRPGSWPRLGFRRRGRTCGHGDTPVKNSSAKAVSPTETLFR